MCTHHGMLHLHFLHSFDIQVPLLLDTDLIPLHVNLFYCILYPATVCFTCGTTGVPTSCLLSVC